ncbi:hypothetical protein GOB85_18665 [Acetobacter sp. LMG 1636]|uniref:Transposase n=1 Tax=Acetobacter fallax TaxID=1737473 RepID=A0ABX0KH22_9PROT|nr:hypothetical protein [Acetobacter fallax]NHO38033.1 hypothetical protein [Acetobacter fallax]
MLFLRFWDLQLPTKQIAKYKYLRWSRPFGQFCGLDKLYPVVVMPPF